MLKSFSRFRVLFAGVAVVAALVAAGVVTASVASPGPQGNHGTNGTNGEAGPEGAQGTPGAPGVDAESPARVVWVADDGTGDYALLSTALAAITDATSSNPYVIKIAPGIYTETASVVLKDYVDVEGSGQDITTINCACGNASNTELSATVSATAITAEIRHLTINNTGGGNDYSTGVWTEDVADGSFSMLHVTATASGGGSSYYGVYNYNSSPSMNNVTATATGGTSNRGVYNLSSSSPSIRNSSITGSPNSIVNSGSSSAQVADTMLDGPVDAGGGLACVGVYTTAFAALGVNCG